MQKPYFAKFFHSVIAAIVTILLLSTVAPVWATNSTISGPWAWSTNTGWLNLSPSYGGVQVYGDHLEGHIWAENVGWIRFGAYSSGGSHTYGNTTNADYGVNNDGAGNLSGYGWGTNIGWVKFNPTNGGVTIDPLSGSWHGYAWSENVGWIRFADRHLFIPYVGQ